MKQYGQYISLLRTRLDYTQKDFAQMLGCDQAMISKIESGEIVCGEIIHHVAWKLGIHPKEFFGTKVSQLEDFHNVEQTKKYIRYLAHKRDYKTMACQVRDCWNGPHFQSKKDHVFLHWHQGIVELHEMNNPQAAKQHLEEALRMADQFETFFKRVEILNSYAIYHLVTGDTEAALHYFHQAENLLSVLDPLIHPHVSVRVLYNLATTYLRLEQFKDSQHKSFQALQICKESKSTYLRGELTYQYGYSAYHLGYKEKAQRCMEKSIIYLLDEEEEELAEYAVQQMHQFKFN
ncbi:hypothetical protein BEP19_14730 [Ammoniphilus oxalaticus]|uniref:HTH cro/C1-type domain-containing protein n=1 Tax=Ammoniphilus oxalaticus TaxID=66863 RepID=A0A419SF16_9BACL|nr:helix-turn-helix transcriptional regulator [Ammoniphilus oxalaticus]RKD21857.1 hypothetical protein BEP19_14730 [Ammoniphilus oxalaticus]